MVPLSEAYETDVLGELTRFASAFGRGELGNEGDDWENLQQLLLFKVREETFIKVRELSERHGLCALFPQIRREDRSQLRYLLRHDSRGVHFRESEFGLRY